MQRMTNDPSADLYNTPALSSADTNIPTQPVGTFIFATNVEFGVPQDFFDELPYFSSL